MEAKIKGVTEYPLSSYQKDIWMEQCMFPGKPIYNIGGYTEVKGVINIPVFSQAIEHFVNRNEMMRAKISERAGEPYLKIFSESLYELPMHDFSGKENSYELCMEWMQSEFKKPFDMSESLFEFAVLKWSDNQYFIFMKAFHLIIDGWGFVLSHRQIIEYYNELCSEGKIEEKQIYSYHDFLLEEQNYLNSKSFLKDREFWKDKYSKIPEPLFNRNVNGGDSDKNAIWSDRRILKIDRDLYNQMTQFSEERGCSIFHFVLGTLFTYFSRVCDKEELVIGVPVLNRNKTKYKQTMGHFANVIPLKISPQRDMNFQELIKYIKNELMECYRHMKVSTGEIYRSVFHAVNEKSNLFDLSFSYEKHGATQSFVHAEIGSHVTLTHHHERNALTVYLREYENADVYIDFSYRMDVFDKFIPIENVISHFDFIFRQVLEYREDSISEIGIVPEYEQKKLIDEFNKTAADYPKDMTIHTLFEEQVNRYPENIAVCLENKKLTYRELNQKANQLAGALREKGVKRDQIVAIMTERSPEMVIGMLGILKAGGAYLTIDPNYPEERMRFMLEDSAAGILLTQKHLVAKSGFEGEVILLDDIRSDYDYRENLENRSEPQDLAYIIYTSGSTGKPKGVMVKHQGILNLQTFFKQKYMLNETDRMLQFASNSFDASVWEIFTSLLTGAGVYLIPKETINNLMEFEKYVNKNGITIALLPPTYLSNLEPGQLPALTRLVTGGSAITKEMVKKWKDGLTYINAYGPTEYSVITTAWTYKEEEMNHSTVPIGAPLYNTRVFILDKKRHILPVGAAGELCIAGDGLARGYLNRPELTAEKFVDNPFAPGEKMYRTGDLARWLQDGNIEFLGRIDDQVKVRGFRIELGEIESQLLRLPEVREAAAIALNDLQGNKYIAAYLVLEETLSMDRLRAKLLQELPDYMVPSCFVQLDSMPLTTNGKIDRKALPEPDLTMDAGAEFVAPGDELEEGICELWKKIFKADRIGINDNFFALGGDSLNAIVLSSEIHKNFNINMPLKEIFAGPTVREIAEYIKHAKEDIYASIKPVEKADYYPMSSAQKRVYVLNQLEDGNTVYNIPGAVLIEGDMSAEKAEAAFKKLIKRHETLRTSFEMADGEPVQRVHEQADFHVTYMEAPEEKTPDLLSEFIKPFDLSKAPLLQAGLVKTEENRHVLLFDMHHIISDGVSMEILIREFSALYEGIELNMLRLQYRDYSAWQNQMYEDGTLNKQKDYWLKTFAGELHVLNLPLDYNRPAIQSFEGDRVRFYLSQEISERLRGVAKENGATMYMVLLAAYNTLLYKYTGQEDITIGSPIAGRPHADLQNMIGMFVNTLAMRNFPQGEKTFQEFLTEVKEMALGAYENQDYPFEELVEALKLKRDVSRNALFDAFFALQSVDITVFAMTGLHIRPYSYDAKMSKFDIALTAREEDQGIGFELAYCTRLFRKETMDKIAAHYVTLLEKIAADPQTKLKDLEMLGKEEFHRIIYGFNDNAAEYSRDKIITGIFEAQAKRIPDCVAVEFEESSLTYGELNARSNQLARVLREKGAGPDKTVGIMAERSVEMIAGIMAVLKAGSAYLPIDPLYPEARIRYMLKDSGTEILLTQTDLLDKVQFDGEILDLKDETLYQGETKNIAPVNTPDNMAYVIYTSGTTGLPKGVMIEHRNVLNLTAGLNREIYGRYEGNLKVALVAPYVFDASVKQIFPALLLGHTLCIVPEEARLDGRSLLQYYKEHSVNVSDGTPAHIRFLESAVQEGADELKVKHFVIGGEALGIETVRSFYDRLAGEKPKITNVYGPTECCVDSTLFTMDCETARKLSTIPIGVPLNNVKAYILGKNQEVLPVGAAGELYISGDGVGRGYLNKKELTEEKFVENPFVSGCKMYRTGDLAKWMPDGTIEFLGRIDYQVKIRGYRIELGEIENRLLAYESIKEAVVIDREDGYGTSYLCAYIAGEDGLTAGELREYLLKDLPEYMVPSYFVRLEKLPLTFNGKVDRKALPEPEGRIDTGVEYAAPEGMVEEKLAGIWQEVLKIDKIGRMENFFELGGHSLKATVLVSKIHREFNISIPLKEIFKRPTIKETAEYINHANEDIYASIKPVKQAEYYPMSSAQKRVYVLGELEDSKTVYNMSGAVLIEGGMSAEKTEAAFKKLIERHETLRTSFEMADGEPVQRVHEQADFHVTYMEAPEEKTQDLLSEFIKPFDLSKAPLLRVGLVKTEENRHVLLFDMHHIISDGVSMEILIREFIALYEGLGLKPLRLQYRDYSAWQDQMYEDGTGTLNKQKDYWLKTFEGELPVLNLPLDYNRPAVQSFEGDRIRFHLNQEISGKLGSVARENGATIYMVLLAAYNTLLYKYTGQEDIIVGSPIAGRPHADLHNIIGMFVNTLAMRNFPQGEKTFQEFLTEVKEMALSAYENQDYPFEELVEVLKLKRDVSRSALFDAFFSLQNADTAELAMDGLNITPYSCEVKMSKFDIALTAREEDQGLGFELAYCTRLFRKETMDKIAAHYVTLLEKIAADPQTKLKDLEMLGKEEFHRIVYGFNDNAAEYSRDKIITGIFEAQAKRIPDCVAVEFEESSLTYGELNARSNQLARVLREKGAGPDKTVGIMAERSVEMIAGIMAVLKAGSAYLPIDPLYPEARIRYMLKDSGTEIVLTQTDLLDKVHFDGEILDLKDETLYQGETKNIAPVNTPDDMAYVIYTSGTTGLPKGVMIEHRNVLNLTAGLNREIYGRYEGNLKVALVAPYVFDASVKQIFPALLLGHTLCIVPEEARLDGRSLLRYYKEHSVNVSDGTPAHIRFLESAVQEGADEIKVKHFVIGGEALGIETVRSFYDRLAGEKPKITNVYGPTECCVDSTLFSLDCETAGELSTIPIGVPLNNVKAYILGKNQEVLPVGAAGELYISGDGVGRGYLNKKELTEEKFVENPFVSGCKMYRTGDLAKWMPDGMIEFLGRIDYQVKIRGYRIELGEIENRLLAHESIKEAVVIDREDGYGTSYLCAYIAGEDGLTAGELREYLLKDLPEYMVPSYFVRLEKLPLTFNGKVDRKALPEPEGRIDTGVEYAAPEGVVEEKLAGIWQEVLKIDKIGRMENFFELGGHSLKATVLVSKIHREFNISIPLKEIFKRPTIKEIAEYIKHANEDIYASIKPVKQAENYPMSSAQKKVYMLSQFEGSGITYNMPGILQIEGRVEKDRLETAFKELIDRHEILRTSFEIAENELVQKVHETVDFAVAYEMAPEKEDKDMIRKFIRPFDLSKAPLLRAGLIKTGEERYLLMFDMHHIISDGVSMEILLREFSALYEGEELKPLQLQYRDYAVWQNQMYENGTLKQQEEYWLKALEGEIPALNMPLDYKRPAVQSFEGDKISFRLSREISKKLSEVANENGATLYMVLLAAYNTLLYRYTGQEDMVVGSPIAGRPHADLQNIIGMFVNTLAMRNFPQGEKTFGEFLGEVKERALGAYENQDYPFEEIVEKLGLKGDMSRNALFDTMFALQNMETGMFELAGLKASPYSNEFHISKFDITVIAVETQEGISFELEYGIKLYRKETMEALAGHFLNILEGVAENPQVKLKDIRMLGGEEQKQILCSFNQTEAEYSKYSTIQAVFEEQVRLYPDKEAVVFEESRLSYAELNARANTLAKELRSKGVGTDKIVAIMADRSLEMIVAMLGVLKAGGAYLPIDPGYPDERIQYMLKDSEAFLVLTQKHLEKKAVTESEVIDLDGLSDAWEENLEIESSASDLAYIIYTSGSTGKPKGVMVEHHGIINLQNYFKRYWNVDETDRMLQFASSSFDASVWEIFTVLLGGGTLYLISKDTINNLIEFETYINKNEITIALLPPTYLAGIEPGKLHTLKKLVTGGSAITKNMAAEWKNSLQYMNAYGPTEYSIISTTWKYREEEMCYSSVPIGKPVDNTRIYILDQYENLLPVGAAGELCVAGEGIARGYLNRPELTAEKFGANPFKSGERMYHTGDLARRLPDGNIEYMGRIDDQVKIRGFRIELGEIEAQLLVHPSVREAVVIACEDSHGDKYLASYFAGEGRIETAELKSHLLKTLPDYMVPSRFMQLDKLPVTSNGKIDKKKLPDLQDCRSAQTEYAAPETVIEERLTDIWQEVLGIDRIGIKDNFFELGGHSLKATVLTSRIHKEFNNIMPLKEIFAGPTIFEMGKYIEHAGEDLYASIQPAEKAEHYPMSSAQKRVYVLCQLEGNGITYNMPFAVKIEGNIDINRLETAFLQLIKRHETLRTSFQTINGELIQQVDDHVDFSVAYKETAEEDKDMIRKFIRPFDLSKAPLLRAGLIKTGEERYLLMFDMHHIISDGVSMEILLREFSALYEGEELKPLQLQYRDYAVWQNQMYENGTLKQQEEYWLKALEGEIPALNMPLDYKRPAVQSFKGDKISFRLSREISKKLSEVANENGATLYMVLLAAYNTLLYRYTGQEDMVVGSPIAGRPHADLQNIIGMFVNTLAMRNFPQGEKTFGEFLGEVKERALGAYENQDYPFEEIVEKLGLKGDMSRNALFDTMFALQNMETGMFELAGLKASPYSNEFHISKFDITVIAVETQEGISFELEYGIKLYRKETMEALAGHFLNILEGVAENPQVKLKDIRMLGGEEQKQILCSFNQTEAEYSKYSTIQAVFEEQVRLYPDKEAVVFEESRLSYAELNARANTLAKELRSKGVGTDKIVAIMADRSLEMIVAMLGVLKAGGAYLPIDPGYPDERIQYMLKDSEAFLVLTQKHLEKKAVTESEVIDLDGLSDAWEENLEIESSASDLAYIIYTSGSTGKPKGVMVEHHGIINLQNYFKRYWNVDETDRMLQFASSSFDASVWEIFTVLLGGGTLYLISKDTINNLIEFETYVNKNEITIALLPPTYLAGIEPGKLHTLKKLVTGGSAITKNMAAEWKNSLQYMNAYGPTEYSIISTTWKYREEEMCYSSVPIGKPVDNTRIYILDQYENLLPVGAAGELCVAGEGIARGYLNRPELTAEKFGANPFKSGERMYRTGDLARWLPDGNIEYLGRIDDQVKIRGFRIELGEIEAQLLLHPSVREAVVIACEDSHGDKYLASYYTGTEELEAAELRGQMAQTLPDYMIPSYFVQLDSMPVTSNGKVDKKALPKPDRYNNADAGYVGPRNDKDAKIQKVWQEVLGIGQIGIDDNFFMLGGNSIKAIQTVSRLAMEFELEINDIFKCATIRVLSDQIKYSKDRLKNVLNAYKEAAATVQTGMPVLEEEIQKRMIKYKTRIQKYKRADLSEQADYNNVLLAGSTGYLGIHMLHQLLKNTDYQIYVPVRGKDDAEARERLYKKLEYYFDLDAKQKRMLNDRVHTFCGDLAKDHMGLSQEMYEALADKIDVIINSAANVKHYGHYSELYDANVAGNERLIEFARTGKKKAYNFISTTSIGEGNIEGKARELFTEYDCDLGQSSENYYVQTKFEAEKMIIKAREEGVTVNVFRVGNLVFDSATGIFQENITNNAFYAMIKSCINIGCFPDIREKTINFSFIDQVAEGVVLLFDKKRLKNETYHLYNSNTVSMREVAMLIKETGVPVQAVPPAEFLENLLEKYDDEEKREDITQILVHTNMLSGDMDKTACVLSNKKTEVILKAAGFEWSKLDGEKVKLMLDHCMNVGFIHVSES